MYIKCRLFTLVFLLSSSLSLAQLENLSLLNDLGDSLQSNTSDNDEDQYQKSEDEIDYNSIRRKDFTNDDYGYTGGENFNNPPKKKFFSEPLEHFGYSFFSNKNTTINTPIPPDYLLGPGDKIKIILFGGTNRKYDLEITREGDIFLPELGPLTIAGLQFRDVQELIKKTVAAQIIGTEASVTLGSLRTIDVYILGSANNPGMYTVSSLSTVMNAIFESGGVDINGSLRNIKLKRNGRVSNEIDFYSLFMDGDTSGDSRLRQGDVILIEPIGKTVAIRGEINKPGIYELKENEQLRDLLNYSGNLKPKANRSEAEALVIDQSTSSYNLIELNLENPDTLNMQINNGDIISIYPINDKIQKAVLVSGHALQPGFYSWNESLKISDLFKGPDDLLEMTDLNYVLLKRKSALSDKFSFLQVDLQAVFSNDKSEDILLSDQDEIILFPSMLTAELISTKLIQDKYIKDEETDELELEDEWDSLTYLRKSILEEAVSVEKQNPITQNQIKNSTTLNEVDIRRYYEYSIYDYCVIPEDIALLVVESSGFKPEKSVPLKDLKGFNTPEDFVKLQQSVEEERSTSDKGFDQDDDVSMMITNLCRNQLLDPIMNIIKRENSVEKLSMVSVFGSVHFPGAYPFTDQMDMEDAIKAAGGPKNGTYNSELELNRLNRSGKRFSSRSEFTNLKGSRSLKLEKMDTVNLKQLSSEIKSVEISGEVYFPGIYPISENQTLSELIKRAGGIKESGSLEAAFFQREELKEAEKDRFKQAQDELRRKILLSSQSGGLGEEALDGNEINALIELIPEDIEKTDALGRLVIDLEGIISEATEDVILEDGDKISIPKFKQSISVIGEVFVANSHLFQKNLNRDDYINLSGGITTFADKSNIYLIRSDGSILSPSQMSSGFFRSGDNLRPGDTIVVPLQVQPFSGIKATTEISQIIYQMAIAAAAVNSF